VLGAFLGELHTLRRQISRGGGRAREGDRLDRRAAACVTASPPPRLRAYSPQSNGGRTSNA
jgi:hypothetical protein